MILSNLIDLQNRQGCFSSQRFRGRWKHVCKASQAASRGVFWVSLLKYLYSNNLQWYRHAHAKDMPLRAIARLIQTMLYARRFFPYYVYNILGGIEEDGMCLFGHTAMDRYS